ncbi:MAG: type IV pilus secretin PilQ [Acidithiobacillus sp.]|nr:type IV pilus secretin PilQ [Acidithiobacillus sp.]
MNQQDPIVTAARRQRIHLPPNALRLACAAALVCLTMAKAAAAETLIQGIQIQPDPKGTSVSIQSNGRPAYDINTFNHGYRVRIDFQDTHILSSAQTVAGAGIIENVLAENDGKTAHLDLLLAKPEAIMVEPSPEGYRVSLVPLQGNQEGAPASSPAAPLSTVNSNSTPAAAAPASALPVVNTSTQIENLRFHREKDGAGMLSLDIQGQQPQLDVTRASDRLIVELRNTQIPASLTHRFGTDQFGTPVQYVDAYPLGNNTRLVLHISGPFEYSAYQLGQQTMISVRHQQANAESENPLASKRLSMDFQNISVRDALQVIADFTHQNIVVSNSVNGSLSIRLKNEPWEEAFQVILQSQGLAVKHIGNILWVAPANQITSQEESELKAAAAKRKLEPLVTELIPLKYARASQIADLLRGFSQQVNQENETGLNAQQGHALATALGIPSENLIGNSLLGPRGSVAVVTRTNSLLVRDTPEDIDNIKKLIAKIDRPVPQVLIEARIVQITTNAAQSLGIQWGGSYTSGGGGGIINLSGTGASSSTSTQGGSYPISGFGGTGSTSGTSTGSTSGGVPAIVNLPAYAPSGSPLTGLNPASLGFALGNASGSRILNLQLQALQAANKAKIISSPKVLTEDNEAATIAQGTEIPYQQASSSGATAVSFKKAELSLKVTPHIAPNGKVTMDVEATNNQPNYAQVTAGGVPINTQEVKTKLLVNNGQTVVIGGIYTETDSRSDSGVPLLKDIPLLGWLFKAKEYSTAQTELLVFLTPKVVGGESSDDAAD